MWLILGLMAFSSRDGALRSGPPTVHLDFHPAVQWSLSGRASWLDLQARWGGRWSARWDERNGTPRFLGVPGVAERDASWLVADVAALAGIDPGELALDGLTTHAHGQGTREIQRWSRRWQGAEVHGDHVSLVITDGRIGAVWVRITPIHGLPRPRAGESVLPVGPRALPTLATEASFPDEIRWIDRSGRVVLRYDPRRWATLSISHEERTVGDSLVEDPARQVLVTDSAGTTETTDDSGLTSLSGALTATLEGPALEVRKSGASVSFTGTDDFTLAPGGSVPLAVTGVFAATFEVRDWLEALWPTHAWLPEVIAADALVIGSGSCNAYYTGGTINFLPGQSGTCYDAGRVADIVYHEYGHGVHDYIIATGTFASDVSEGSSDYVAATILDDAYVSRGWLTYATYLRELDTDKVYPTDMTGESHNDGLIWGSFLWNLRELWAADYGTEAGVEMSDLLFLGALEQGPEMTDLYEAVLVADDDDGDWSNGTPHECELVDLLEQHGLGPGPLGLVSLIHTPLEPAASADTGYPLSFDLFTSGSTCVGTELGGVSLWYTSDSDAALPEEGQDPSALGWTSLELSNTDDSWSGVIPRHPANVGIRYYIEVSSSDGTQTETSHDGDAEKLYAFWVGDRSALWCDDFETGGPDWTHASGLPWAPDSGMYADDWAIGALGGGRFDPEAAYGGGSVAGTALDGEYTASNISYLRSPSTDLSAPGLMRLLSMRRQLSVEDALYDQAGLWVSRDAGTTWSSLWSNNRTDGGDSHTMDEDWRLREHELSALLAEDGSASAPLEFAFTLQSDAGLEFGGWNLDDVCVVELADVPGHYRADDLALTKGDSEVSLTWTTPWIHPLFVSVLVRQEGGYPTGIDDGLIVDLDLSPTAGEVRTVSEPLGYAGLDEGSAWYYALFTAGRDDEDWYTGVVEGENGAVLDLPAPVVDSGDTGGSGDTGEVDSGDPVPDSDTPLMDDEEPKDAGRCGCASTPAASGAWAALAGLLLIRRRRA